MSIDKDSFAVIAILLGAKEARESPEYENATISLAGGYYTAPNSEKIEFLLGSKKAVTSELLKLNELILKIDSELIELGHKDTNLVTNDR
ncbi:hypothetical protein CF116_09265 [Aeromonas veronii]|uniref:hypothetical protein n=1 Tax=Aeromonas veronii TaxID=654 RepID=UPI001117B5FA|nr:hypothetical protein [Aeromonas veronii]TNI81167.1 hypothetical protein CF116_09265 [Aeromonas veronii]